LRRKLRSTPTHNRASSSPADPALWEYGIPERFVQIAISDGVYVATDTTLSRLSPTGEIEWTLASDSDS